MSRNSESRFALNPTSIDIRRSTFNRSSSVKTSFNIGDIVPFYLDEVLPGDTFDIKTSKVARLSTLLTPIMDNIQLDTYYFFVPNRLVWSHWREFMGENTKSSWLPETQYQIPQIKAPSGGWRVGTVADYFGIPVGVDNISVSHIPFRAYALICNDWFRDENLSDPVEINVDEATVVGKNTGVYVTDLQFGGLPYKAAKYHDYFTSALPAPQKGPDVSIPVGGVVGQVPVYGSGKALAFTDGTLLGGLGAFEGRLYVRGDSYGKPLGSNVGGTVFDQPKVLGVPTKEQLGDYPENSGLYADMTIGTINQLRLAFQIQKLYERDARGGTRYIEIIKSHFGVISPDSRLQRPEYLGGNRIPLNVSQVVQTGATGSTPQGNVAGYSLTTDVHGDFKRSFTEHGYVIGLVVARYDHTYQQGIERHWSRKNKLDYYWPALANIGEQAIKNKEIYAQGSTVLNSNSGKPYDDEVFGYQEAFAEYRYKPSIVTGQMRSAATQPLDHWHLADDYNSMPFLSDGWIREDKNTVDRVLAVSSSVSNQIIADIYVRNVTTRPMPMYSIPGLMDHH